MSKTFFFAIFLAGINIALVSYHLLVVKPMIEMAAIERGAYIMDVEGLTAFKAAQLVREYQEGRVDLSSPEAMKGVLTEFRGDLKRILKETVGDAPVFLPKAVVNAEGFVDLTQYVAQQLNIDFRQNYLNITADGNAAPARTTE